MTHIQGFPQVARDFPQSFPLFLKSCSKSNQKLLLVTKVAQKVLEKTKTFFGLMLKYANCTTKVRSNVYNQQDILHGYCSYFNSVIIKVSKHFCAILRRNQRCELNEPPSFPCHFMSVELSFYTYLMTIVSFSVNGNEVVFHFSNLPQKLYSH